MLLFTRMTKLLCNKVILFYVCVLCVFLAFYVDVLFSEDQTSPQSQASGVASSDIEKIAQSLAYSKSEAQEAAKMIGGWGCDLWKHRIDKTKDDYEKSRISASQFATVQLDVVKDIYNKIEKEIAEDTDGKYYYLPRIIKDRKADCLGYSQLFYMIGRSIGLDVKFMGVFEPYSRQVPESRWSLGCLVYLDGKVILVNMRMFVSEPFKFENYYNKNGIYWELKQNSNPLNIHKKIKIYDTCDLITELFGTLGNEYSAQGQEAEALSCFTKVIEYNPKSAWTYYNRGNAYSRMRQFDKAIEDYEKAISTDPRDFRPYCSLGNLCVELGRDDAAFDYYKTAIEKNPNADLPYYCRGVLYLKKKQIYEAYIDFTKAIELNPRNWKAYYNRALVHWEHKLMAGMIDDLSKAIEINPRDSDAYCFRGLAYSIIGQDDKAMSDFNKAIELDPKNALAYLRRGELELKKGQKQEAEKDRQKAFELNPKLKEDADSDR